MIALDATYSIGRNLSGVAVYSREILYGMAEQHPEEILLFYYRPHRWARSWRERLPKNARRRILHGPLEASLFHALNQRVDFRARRTVATFHDLFVMTGEYSTPEFRARFTAQARDAAARSDLIIAVSEFTAGQVEQLLGVEKSRIRVIPHGVHKPEAQRDPKGRENLILTVGAVQKRKNIGRLVRAFESMPPGWRLAIAGSPDGYGAAAELGAVEKSPRRADIDVLGYVSLPALEKLYQRARIFAFPSLDEGFGMPVLEAMAHGAAVVTSGRSGVAETAGDAALLVDPENVEELAEALRRLAADVKLAQKLVQKGWERALQFSWKNAVARTWRVYQDLGLRPE
ncbi:MAG TPA: glycosyltransferase family 1 protein [Bryobacteraceae bacterium]|nr:glycosyltransferase family 1 protein [Bryobacteraceae bacterium]